jgi:predicted DCC family thiol-disulfide oxidoreductase YuxK
MAQGMVVLLQMQWRRGLRIDLGQEAVIQVDTRVVLANAWVPPLCLRHVCSGCTTYMCRFAPLQSEAGRSLLRRCGRQPDDISSIVLVEDGRCLIKSEAILQIAQQLDAPWPWVSAPGFVLPLGLRDVLYDQVANNRYTVFGKRKACRACDGRLSGENFLS